MDDAEVNQFQNGKPLKLQSEHLTQKFNELKKNLMFKEMLDLSPTLKGHQKYLVEAHAFFYLNKMDQVIKCCNNGIKVKEDSQFYNFKARALGKQGKHKDKLQIIDKAIKLDPNIAAYHRNKGAVLYKLKEYEKSLESHSKAIQIEPKVAINYHNKGASYYRLGNLEEAKKYFLEAVIIDKQMGLSVAWLANVELQLKNEEKAVGYYMKAFELTNNPQFKEKAKNLKKKIQEKQKIQRKKQQQENMVKKEEASEKKNIFQKLSNLFKK